MPTMRLVALAGLALVALAVTAPALAKGDSVATILTPIPAGAEPGTLVRVAWKIHTSSSPQHPINADGVYVRVEAADGTHRDAYAAPGAHEDGVYGATVRIPEGGVRRVAVGVVGTATYADGRSVRTDYFFPLTNEPMATASSGRSWTLPATALGLTLLTALALLAVRRAAARGEERRSLTGSA